MTHPIAQTLRRAARRRCGECHLGLRVGSAGGAWVSVATLAGDEELLQAKLNAVGVEIGSERPDVQASIFLEAYAWRLVLPLAGALVAEQRVAAPAPHDVALRRADARPGELLLTPGRFSTLPGDTAAGHRDAAPAGDRAALAASFESALISHFEGVVDALNRSSGRSARALWRTIADRTATALLYAGVACDDRRAGEELAHQILGGGPPLRVTPAYASILVQGRPSRVHLRAGCCLWWRTAAAAYCATCPLQRRSNPLAQAP